MVELYFRLTNGLMYFFPRFQFTDRTLTHGIIQLFNFRDFDPYGNTVETLNVGLESLVPLVENFKDGQT